VKHTVWYADGTTLSQWIDAAKAKGIQNIAIWRLDELGSESLEQLRIQPGNKIE
jgi:spore germination protein